jgi:predicted TIM-barrel fold metal-dependent hydrolase
MITDSHMHIGEFPLFNVSLDGDKLADYLLENGISMGLVFSPDESFVWPFMELAIEFDVPVLFHCGTPIFTEPWSIEEVIARYEDAKVILGHMGHTNIVYIDGSIAVAERHSNVWLETSGMPMGSKIYEAVRRVGPDRVMYGSDGPFHHPKVEQLKVQLSGLTGSDLEDVMNNTAQRLFFSSPRLLR